MEMDGVGGELLGLLNRLRAEPSLLLADLELMKRGFRGNVYSPAAEAEDVLTEEGAAAVEDAISFLKAQPAAPPLQPCPSLAKAAQSLATHLCQRGLAVPAEPELLAERRLPAVCGASGSFGENVLFGWTDARAILLQMVVDDGVRGRGHRRNCLSAMFDRVGVAVEPHAEFAVCCVLSFRGESAADAKELRGFALEKPRLTANAELIGVEAVSASHGGRALTYAIRLADGSVRRQAAEHRPVGGTPPL